MTNKNDDKKTDGTKPSATFRQKAEERLKVNQSKKKVTTSDIETYKLIHELEVHQIELEMQQEELTLAKELAEAASAKFTQLYDFAPSGYLTLSSIGEILSLNFAAAKLLGNGRGNLIDKHFSTFLSYQSKKILGSFLDALFQSQVTQTAEVELALKDKPPVYLLLTGIADDSNSFCNITFTDFTERKKNELLLQDSNNKYKYLFDNNPLPLFIFDFETLKIIDCNTESLILYGYSREEFLQLTIKDIRPKEDIALILETTESESSYGEIHKKVWRHLKKNGELMYVEVTGHLLDYNDRRSSLALINDITEQKKSAAEKIKIAERLQLATKSANMGIWDWDIKNNVLAWDDGMFRLYNIAMNEFNSVYEGWFSRLHPEDTQQLQNELELALANKKDYKPTFRIIWDDSSIHYISASAIIERDNEGNAIRMIGVNWDVTAEKEKEQHLKLLESVITNTTDSVMITEAEPFDDPGPRILYVNEAFTKMTGYSSEEVIGKSPRILQGPKSDKAELKRLGEAIRKWETYEITIINYKKNGEEFWANFSVNPVANERGWYTHFIAIERDVSGRKNEELQNELIAEISTVFSEPLKLHETLDRTLRYIADFSDFCFAEAWLTSSDKNALNKISSHATTENLNLFLEETKSIDTFNYGESFPGNVFKTKEIVIWGDLANQKLFLRRDAALKYGLKTLLGLPLFYNNEVIGVLAFGLDYDVIDTAKYLTLFKKLGDYLAPEIKRKQLELELKQMFNFAPDLIVTIGLDGCFKRVNPAACQLLEYTQEELCVAPYLNFIHPDDKEKSNNELAELLETNLTYHFENRYITKSGKIKWLDWNAIYATEDNTIYAVAKDVTDKKELENLLEKANSLARIGSWDVDLVKQTVYWNDITREIHEAESSFIPDLATGLNFYKEGTNRELITQKVKEAIELGTPWDEELEIVTAKNNVRWIRTIGETEFVDGKCVKIYGSFQDITEGRLAVEKIKESEARLAASQSVAKVGSWETDLTNLDVIWSDETCRIFGVDNRLPHTTHENFLKFVHPDDKEKVDKAFLASFTSDSLNSIEHRIIAADGVIKEVDERWLIAKDENGKPIRALGTVQDITERKKAAEEIINTEKKFRALIENSTDGLTVIAADGTVLDMSPSGKKILGYDKNEIIGSIRPDLIHTEDSSKINGAFVDVIKDPAANKLIEYRHKMPDETYKWLECSFKNLLNEPYINAIVLNYRDITERKLAEENFKSSEIRYRRLFETAKDGILILNADTGSIEDVNPYLCEMLHYPREAVLGKQLWEIGLFKDIAANKEAFLKLKKTKYERHDNLPLVTKEGQSIWVEFISNVYEESGTMVIQCNVRNITERKKAEEKLTENENYLRTILDTEPECVKILNSKGELISMNPAGLVMIEADNEQQVLGHKMTELVVEKYREGFNNLSKAVFKGNSGNFEFEITGLKGKHRWMETHAVPLKDASGKITGLLGVTRDITERKQIQTELENKTHQLRQLTTHLQTIREEERKHIAREIHDELGQQLTALKMDTVWINKQLHLDKSAVKDKLQNMLELLDGSHHSVRKILNQLRPAVLDDNDLLEALQWQSRQFTESTGKPVQFSSNYSTIKLQRDTATCIFRVYQEALTNIMRYADANKVISSLNITNDKIILVVEDDGNGFDTAEVESKKRFGILGMKERVNSEKGNFSLVSSPGKGTKITIDFPYKK